MNKRLYRSYKDKMLGGVAGGLAEYFNIDPTLVRVLFLVVLFIGGTGILAYIIMWIIIPEEPIVFPNPDTSEQKKEETETDPSKKENQFDSNAYYAALDHHREKRRTFAGIIVLALGIILLADNFVPRIRFGDFWPLILVAVGVAILLSARSKNNYNF